ncbi:hypothetical protein B0T25DRAFT_10222 [Lasiosphaeria hispida]|uniref:Uncharacterized protein n=1 Tax=Lasiosphaeria hispida TaxID=260671 RepID=A0AAJ0MJF1_9PEZI|nr:hypothetical protein B0T25DRAFT_10222 [Lasiosphaeria hispida]
MSVSTSASTWISAASPALTDHSTAPSLDVFPQDFTRLDQERELRRWAIRFRRYDTKERILIVLIPGGPHEQLHLKLYREHTDELYRMGLRDAWNHGATRFPQQQGHPSGNGGEGDSGGSPRPQLNGKNWPTLVIEAGDSSSLEELRRGMRWWFSASNHDRLRLFSWLSWIELEGESFWRSG